MSWKRKYRVLDAKTGKVLAEGYAEDCAKKVNCNVDTIYAGTSLSPDKVGPRRRFIVTVLPDDSDRLNVEFSSEQLSLAKQWDDFCEPLRKKFGIEVKR